MKKIYILIIVLLLTGCSSKYKTIDKNKSMELIENKNAVIIDVRSMVEYNDKHIENAILMPLTTILNDIESKYKKDKYIIVYCKSGSRSKTAAEGLIELGYKHIYDLGSIDNWK